MTVVLGLDAGGTKTLAAMVGTNGALKDLVRGPGLDPTRVQDPAAALSDILMPLVGAESSTLGLPYFGEVSRLSTMYTRIAHEVFGPMARACNDVEVAHIGAFGGGDGVLCLAGTGSMAWAKGPNGTTRAGGFGDLIGDEGSAFKIGQGALNILSHQVDGRHFSSPFGLALAEALNIAPSQIMEWIYALDDPRAGIARVARHVSVIAQRGDPTACQILKDAGAELAAMARAAALGAGVADDGPWALAGSVFADPIVRTQVMKSRSTPARECMLPPVGGAALDAAQRAGWSIDQEWISALRRDLEQSGVI